MNKKRNIIPEQVFYDSVVNMFKSILHNPNYNNYHYEVLPNNPLIVELKYSIELHLEKLENMKHLILEDKNE